MTLTSVPELRRDATGRRVTHVIGGASVRVAQPVTFTPFASARPCSARCVFCSETLRPRGGGRLSASLRPGPGYFDGLRRVLSELRGLPVGYSLSGLEATDDPDWLEPVLDLLQEHAARSLVRERVLYTNAAGLARETSGVRLLPRLAAFGLTRAEVSRHHHRPERNDPIMRFRPGRPIRDPAVFERAVRDSLEHLPVRLVCVIQKGGVDTLSEALDYLSWAAGLGVRDVVFREFSRLHDLYEPNATSRAIERGRIPIDDLLEPALARTDFEPVERVRGYYYRNVRFAWRGLDVTFETSDYQVMKSRHRSDTVYKLVYHANGNLSGDWDPESRVLLRTA